MAHIRQEFTLSPGGRLGRFFGVLQRLFGPLMLQYFLLKFSGTLRYKQYQFLFPTPNAPDSQPVHGPSDERHRQSHQGVKPAALVKAWLQVKLEACWSFAPNPIAIGCDYVKAVIAGRHVGIVGIALPF